MENNENNLELSIKKHLEEKMADLERVYPDCPAELELSDYLDGRLSQEKEQALLEHLAHCTQCLSLLELAQRAKKESGVKPTSAMIERAKNIAPKQTKKTIFNYQWPLLAFVSFALSFIFTRYFLQFLVLAVVFSIKWIFDTATTRTLIMIYQAWRKKDKGTAQRIIQDLQNKIEQRK